MYLSSPSPLGAKIVSVNPLRQAAAGLGELALDDLSSLDAENCLGIGSGFDCRTGACVCLDLGDPATLVEFKALIRAATGTVPSPASLWTASDDALLLHWVDSVTGSLGRHGLMFSGDVAQLGPNGHVTLTPRGIRVLVAEANATEADFPIVVGVLNTPQRSTIPTEPTGSAVAAHPSHPSHPHPDERETSPRPHPSHVVSAHLQPAKSGLGRALAWSMVGATVMIGAYYLSTPQGRKLFA